MVDRDLLFRILFVVSNGIVKLTTKEEERREEKRSVIGIGMFMLT